MWPSSLGGGRILRRTLSVRLSICPSVPLSLPSVTSFRQPLASRMYFSARTEAAYRTAISAAQILVLFLFFIFLFLPHRICMCLCLFLWALLPEIKWWLISRRAYKSVVVGRRAQRDVGQQTQNVTATEDVQVKPVDADGPERGRHHYHQQQQQLVSAGCGRHQRHRRRRADAAVRQRRDAADVAAGTSAARQHIQFATAAPRRRRGVRRQPAAQRRILRRRSDAVRQTRQSRRSRSKHIIERFQIGVVSI